MPEVNLNPYTAENAAIQRRLQMAQMLSQEAMQPMQLPQQQGVRASHLAGLAKVLQAYNAGQMEKSALEQQQELANKYQAGNAADISNFLGAMQGTPQKELAGPAPQGAPQGVSRTEVTQPYTDAQGVEYKGGEPIQGGYIQPAQAPDRTRAMALALGSQNPTLQGAGSAMLGQMFAQDKIKDFKVELVNGKTHRIGYTETGKRTDLGEIAESISPDKAAQLKQDKEQADRAFSQLSASQKATLANDAARLNISAQQLWFDTGIKAGGGSFVNPLTQPTNAPPAQPNAPVVTPRVPTTPVAGAPVANAPPTSTSPYTPFSNLNAQANDLVLPPKLRLEQMKNAPTQENTLRDEFNTLTKDFRTVQDAHSKIKSVANTGAGDMSLLYSYVKLLDPGSVVRESEFATAAASGSFGERIQGLAQRVMSGQRLPPDLRTDFIREADSIYTSQKDGADRLEKQYRDIAKRGNLNPENVIVNYASSSGTALPPVNTLKEGQVTTFGNGQQWTLKNGKQVQVK
jgi:hypothetical protein